MTNPSNEMKDSLEDEIMSLSIEEVRSELDAQGIGLTSNDDLDSYGIIADELEMEVLSLSHADVKSQLHFSGIDPCTDSELENIFIEMVCRDPNEPSLIDIEQTVEADADATIAVRGGVVGSVAAGRIVVYAHDHTAGQKENGIDIYAFTKYTRSNKNTYINQRPLVRPGDMIVRGDVLIDATIIDIHELNCVARATTHGPEEISADVPNVSNALLCKLDECGVIYVGSEVKPNDILVGKVTPNADEMSAEKKLLHAIFGEKASDFKDASLRVPSDMDGTVIGIQVLTQDGVEKDAGTLQIEREQRHVDLAPGVLKMVKVYLAVNMQQPSKKKLLLQMLRDSEQSKRFAQETVGDDYFMKERMPDSFKELLKEIQSCDLNTQEDKKYGES